MRTHPNWENKPVPDPSAAAPAPSAITPASNITSVTLLLDNMTRVLSVDKAANQMRVQAGMLITQLLKEATAAGMSVPLGTVPAFGDLTLGGVLVTGAHGTGHQATSSLVSIKQRQQQEQLGMAAEEVAAACGSNCDSNQQQQLWGLAAPQRRGSVLVDWQLQLRQHSSAADIYNCALCCVLCRVTLLLS